MNEEKYLTQFESFRSGIGEPAPAWLQDIRKGAIESFAEQGFPGTKDEGWRFTRLRPMLQHDFTLVTKPSPNGLASATLAERTFDDEGCHRLVFVDGHFVDALSDIKSLPKGAIVTSIAAAIAREDAALREHLTRSVNAEGGPFAALNTAHIHDGAFVNVPKGTAVEAPIHLIFVSTSESPFVAHPRNLVIAGPNANATIIESYVSEGADVYLNNAASEFVVGDGANVRHYKVQKESQNAYHIATTAARIGRSSRFLTEFVSLGGDIVRNDVKTDLDGEGIDCTLNGLYMANGHQHIDNHTNIEHAKPHCDSHELYKGILADRAKAVFNGKIHVHPDAQKTDAKQSNGCMLLSDNAQINTNPQLEIYADDVKCTHGAVVGQIDDNAVYYLRTRGISKRDARHMLIFAFAGAVLERIEVPALRERLEMNLSDWLDNVQPVGQGV